MTTLEGRALAFERDGRVIFADVALMVGPHDRLAIFGPSGCGKTSLVSVLARLEPPSAGQVLIDGVPAGVGHRPDVAIVPQTYGLVSLLTAAENLEAALRASGRTPTEAIAVAKETLESVGLADQRDQLVDELSGGQQQRVAVARALALGPAVLIADEPTAELDAEARELVLHCLFEVAELGRALILTTHDPEVAQRCDRVLHLGGTRQPPTP